MGKPSDLAEAEWVLAMCQRFSCLPSALLAEDASFLNLLALESAGRVDTDDR